LKKEHKNCQELEQGDQPQPQAYESSQRTHYHELEEQGHTANGETNPSEWFEAIND
jgi:hypothetical protein